MALFNDPPVEHVDVMLHIHKKVPFSLLNGGEAKVLIEQWRKEYKQVRPHSALGYRPPAPEAILTVT